MSALDDVVAKVQSATSTRGGPWTLAQTLSHCAQSIEYSLTGYPKNANVVVRKIFGPMVMRKFLRNGAMKHDLGAALGEIRGRRRSRPRRAFRARPRARNCVSRVFYAPR